MGGRAHEALLGVAFALCRAQVLYWTTVAPRVRRELERWDRHAASIPDPVLRACAQGKLRDERANTEATATLYTLAPHRHRHAAVSAGVALQVMYDYLDAVHEQPLDDPIAAGEPLFRAFSVALTPGESAEAYYRMCPYRDDNGYLDALVQTLRDSVVELPASDIVLPAAQAAARRFGEGQIRSHAVSKDGVGQLEAWALGPANSARLTWWEWAGGAAASVLGIHALLAAAADRMTSTDDARRLDAAYLIYSALATVLDSLVDDSVDDAGGEHRYVAYYSSSRQAECRIVGLVRSALSLSRSLPNAGHHAMTVSGIVAFYLSTRRADGDVPRAIGAPVIDELKPMIIPLVAVFRAWRRISSHSTMPGSRL